MTDDDLPSFEPPAEDKKQRERSREKLDQDRKIKIASDQQSERQRAVVRAAPKQSVKDQLIRVLTDGHALDPRQLNTINAIAEFGIQESDPLWVLLLPTVIQLSRAEDDIATIRDIVTRIKLADPAKPGAAAAGLDELSEAQRETTAAINAFNIKLEKSVERAVAAALAKSETTGGVDQAALAKSVSESIGSSIGSRLLPARLALVAGAIALVGALSFVAGVMMNKSGYDKYIAELEGKIQGYQTILAQQKQMK